MKPLKNKLLIILIALPVSILPLAGNAQFGNPGPGSTTMQADPIDPCDDPDIINCSCPNAPVPPCPIDGGLSVLIAAGLGIGAGKAYKTSRKKAVL